jgi:hypothetical protein
MFYFGSMRNIGPDRALEDLFFPDGGYNTRQGGGGVEFCKTSPSGSGTISCGPSKQSRGAQPGNRQALKTGQYTSDKQKLRKDISRFIRTALHIADMVEVRYGGKPRRRRKRAALS